MKKIIALILCLQILNLPVLAGELIEDTFAKTSLGAKNLHRQVYKPEEIKDNVILPISNRAIEKPTTDETPITDNFAKKTLPAGRYKLSTAQQAPIQNEVTAKLKKTASPKVAKTLDYDFTDIKSTPIKISITSDITTQRDLIEGQWLEFRVLNDAKINPEITIKKDSIINARLETISPNQAFGAPADLVIDNFSLTQPNQTDIKFEGTIRKTGANRALWVYPVGYLGVVFCCLGLLVLPIRGGHAKVKTKEVFEVFYTPNL